MHLCWYVFAWHVFNRHSRSWWNFHWNFCKGREFFWINEIFVKKFPSLFDPKIPNFITFFFQYSARKSYKKCIHNSAMAQCNPRSVKLAQDLVDLLSNERQFKNCAEIERTSLCGGGGSSFSSSFFVIMTFTAFTIIKTL